MKRLNIFLSFFLAVTLCSFAAEPQSNEYMFRHISAADGLSNNNVRCILKDRKGFIWIGTTSGLNRYDGYSFKTYYVNNSALESDAIGGMFETEDGDVWVHTPKGYSVVEKDGNITGDYLPKLRELGLDVSDPVLIGQAQDGEYWATDKDYFYLGGKGTSPALTFPLNNKSVRKVSAGENIVCLMTGDGQLYSISMATGKSETIEIPEEFLQHLRGKDPVVYVDRHDTPWVYSYQNSFLAYFDALSRRWEKLDLHMGPGAKFNRIQQVLNTGDGKIWIITNTLGLFIYDPADKSLVHCEHQMLQPHTITSNNIQCVYEDRDGLVWLGYFRDGVSYYSPSSQAFLSFGNYRTTDITTMCQVDDEDVLIGTDGDGLMLHSLTTGGFKDYPIPANIILGSLMDSQGRVWVGTFHDGLFCLDGKRLRHFTAANSPLLDDNVYSIKEDGLGYLWIATMRGKIQRLNLATNEVETMLDESKDIFVRDMCFDGRHTLLVATASGLLLLDTATGEHRLLATVANGKVPDSDLQSVFVDSRGLAWIGHTHGLEVWDMEKDRHMFFNTSDGLPSDLANATIEDDDHNVWVGTANGISFFHRKDSTYSVASYGARDGLMSNYVNVHAMTRLRNGKILVGTPRGLQVIIPNLHEPDRFDNRICLTDIHVYPTRGPVRSLPEDADRIVLGPRERTMDIALSALDFKNGNKTDFCYNLDNSGWIKTDRNKISLSSLSPGKHELKIRCRNFYGVSSPHERTVQIRMRHALYDTWFAYLAYLAVLGLAAYYVYRFLVEKKKDKALLETLEKDNEDQRRLMEMKLQFFANISHEFRTPLTLIINPLNEFISSHPEYGSGALDIVKRNSEYLLDMITKLLDFRKLDAKSDRLNPQNGDIVLVMDEVFHYFDPVAKRKGIEYVFETPKSSFNMDFDVLKVREIALNLLSNAFKFTPEHGKISVSMEYEEDTVTISFADTGCGIRDDEKDKVFQRFYQSPTNSSSEGGSGIGLFLVSQYVEMHKGTIKIEDNKPSGSVFVVRLPVSNEEAERLRDEAQDGPVREEEQAGDGRVTILFVDDNKDMLQFMSDSLSRDYRVLLAGNGVEALDVIEKEDVDLVISDVMMPEMDGIELCKRLKGDIRFSHIPIILLTAKSSEEHQLEGLNVGACDYVTKPFNMRILKLKIKNIVEMEAKRQEEFQREIVIEPSKITITPLDQKFVEDAIAITEENMGNGEFSVDELAAQLNISRSYFYKKMVKITGKKPIDFIRTIRMKRALQLLSESQMHVSEIAYELGYSAPELFTKHFKSEFGVSPSDYKKNHESIKL